MGVRIAGVGSYLPKTTVTREQWIESRPRYGEIPADFFDIPDVVHHAGEAEGSAEMGAKALREAMENGGHGAGDIDQVLCFSVIPDKTYPKDGQAVVRMAGLTRATAIDMDVACASFTGLLKVGAAMVKSGICKRVALVSTANWVHRAIDKTQDYSPLGDGAAAVILEASAEDGFIGVEEARDERFFDFVKMNSSCITGCRETIQFKFTDEFKDFVKTDSVRVAKELMARSGLPPAKVDWLVLHQVGIKPMRGWCRNLELDQEKLLSTYMWTGNTMGSNMPMVLDHYINKDKKIRRGDVVLFFALSSGFHASAVLWRY